MKWWYVSYVYRDDQTGDWSFGSDIINTEHPLLWTTIDMHLLFWQEIPEDVAKQLGLDEE